MGLSYTEFKEYVRQREFDNYRTYLPMVNVFNEFYEEDDIKYFYPINIFNEKPTELLFFLEQGYLVVRFNDNKIILEQYNCKLIKKTLTAPLHNNGEQELKLIYDDGNELTLKNLDDSNENWLDEYTCSIRELYKILKN